MAKGNPSHVHRLQLKKTSDGKPEYQLYFGLWLPVSIESFLPLNSRVSRVIVSGLCRESKTKSIDFPLFQRGIGRSQHTSKTWFGKDYFWHFLEKALGENVDLRNLEPSIEKYCHLKGYKNPTYGSLEYLEFFVALALDVWKERIESKSK